MLRFFNIPQGVVIDVPNGLNNSDDPITGGAVAIGTGRQLSEVLDAVGHTHPYGRPNPPA